jgi:hypothetical protein
VANEQLAVLSRSLANPESVVIWRGWVLEPCLTTPFLFRLALHRRRRWVLELQPVLALAAAIDRAQPLRHDAFEAHLAGVPEDDIAVMR